MAERTGEGRSGDGGAAGAPRSVEDARRKLAATRRKLSGDLDAIEDRLRGAAEDIRDRVDLLEPARERIRADVWASLAVAFGAGLAYGLVTAKRRDGRRGRLGRVLHGAAAQLPGAILTGVRTGVTDRLRRDWNTRRALPAGR